MLLATIAYMIAIEIGRLNIVGPTVDAIRLNEPFGILALILWLRCEYLITPARAASQCEIYDPKIKQLLVVPQSRSVHDPQIYGVDCSKLHLLWSR